MQSVSISALQGWTEHRGTVLWQSPSKNSVYPPSMLLHILLVLLLIISAASWKPGSPTAHLLKSHLSRVQITLCKPLWVERWKSTHVETFSLNPRLIPLHEKNRLRNTYQRVFQWTSQEQTKHPGVCTVLHEIPTQGESTEWAEIWKRILWRNFTPDPASTSLL